MSFLMIDDSTNKDKYFRLNFSQDAVPTQCGMRMISGFSMRKMTRIPMQVPAPTGWGVMNSADDYDFTLKYGEAFRVLDEIDFIDRYLKTNTHNLLTDVIGRNGAANPVELSLDAEVPNGQFTTRDFVLYLIHKGKSVLALPTMENPNYPNDHAIRLWVWVIQASSKLVNDEAAFYNVDKVEADSNINKYAQVWNKVEEQALNLPKVKEKARVRQKDSVT